MIKSFQSILICLLFFVNYCIAQTVPTSYGFIKTGINRIENDSNYLDDFYNKLYKLKTEKQGVIRIVHIGDSHIQADGLSGTVRQDLQENFGNAGRGLVFPYRVANTNGPDGLTSGSNVLWEAKRNVFFMNPIPIGISGITIETQEPDAYITEMVSNTPLLDYGFTHASVFYEQGPYFYDFRIEDSAGVNLFLSDSSNTKNVKRFNSKTEINSIKLTTESNDSILPKTARMFGILLENDSPGVIYNMIGVNGAEYKHYLNSLYFSEQLAYLRPDLIIVSLGTNEAMNANFKADEFYETIAQTIVSIKMKSPNAKFILTTPPDSYRWYNRRLYKNINTKTAAATIIKYCRDNDLAYWDLNAVMGGYGSMAFWARAGLSARDYVHFRQRGYQIQGNLLYNALIHNYEKQTK